MAAINRVGFEEDKSGVEKGIRFWGNSFVYGPQGEELFLADKESELCACVELDLKRSENVRRWWPFLRDRRMNFLAICKKDILISLSWNDICLYF